MTDHLDVLTPTPRPGRGPGPAGRLVLLFLWAVLGFGPVLLTVDDLGLAAGHTGTPGVVTVESCVTTGHGKGRRTHCEGTFRPDDGGRAVAVDASPESSVGDVVHVRLPDDGGQTVRDGTVGVLSALTLPWLGAAVLAFLPWTTRWAFTGAASRRGAALAATVAGVASVGVLVGLVAAYS